MQQTNCTFASAKRSFLKSCHLLLAIFFICFFGQVTTYGQGCDMGNAYSYTDVWTVGGNFDFDSDGVPDVQDGGSVTSPAAVGQGVVENSYNGCGHEYYTDVTMTGPDGSISYGLGSASLELIVDGDYFAESQLMYYCPIAARDFEGGFTSNYLEAGAVDFYYKFDYQFTVGGYPVCAFIACNHNDTSHPCFKSRVQDVRYDRGPCGAGIRVTRIRTRVPLVGIMVCVTLDHQHLADDPCIYGTL